MTRSLRHFFLLLSAVTLVVGCKDNSIPSDALGTDGIKQGKIFYDSIPGMREASGDTLDLVDAIKIGMNIPVGETTSEYYYVIGYVKEYYNPEKNKFDPTYGNICVTLTNRLQNRTFVCYRMKSFKGAMFTSQDQVQPGDIIVVRGQINNYNNAPQMPAGCQLVASDNPNSGYVPDPIVVLSESFDPGIGLFTVDTKQAASVDVWQHKDSVNGKQGYMCATALINNTAEESESWLVSPELDLTKCPRGAQLSFSHYAYSKTDVASDIRDGLLQVMARKDGGNWEPLTLDPTMWNQKIKEKRFTQATIDLSNYISPKTQIAFSYKSSTATALMWSVQNVRIGEPEPEE